jgi:glycine dehydrogenase subunit 2
VRTEPIGLPGLSEPEAMRHYVRLSQKNHAIDLAMYPLGSCTMKHNPRLNERMARLPGFATCTRCSRSRRSRARWS